MNDTDKLIADKKAQQATLGQEIKELESNYGKVMAAMDKRYIIAMHDSRETVFDLESGETILIKDARSWLRNSGFKLRWTSTKPDGRMEFHEEPFFPIWEKKTTRRYHKVIFNPKLPPGETYDNNLEVWNTWQGFPYKAGAGSCGKYLKHVQEVICQLDYETYNFVMDWMAAIIQHPEKKNNIAIAVKGDQGTGKGVFINIFGKLLGKAFYEVNDSGILTNQFNSQLFGRLLVHFDEALFTPDHSTWSKLKNLITSPIINITFKGKETRERPNYLRLIFSTNKQWGAPAEHSNRRYYVVEAGNSHKNDKAWFDAIFNELNNNNGYAALMKVLMERDVRGRDWTKLPWSKAAHTDIYESADITLKYLHDSLNGSYDSPFMNVNLVLENGLEVEVSGFAADVILYAKTLQVRPPTFMAITNSLKLLYGKNYGTIVMKRRKVASNLLKIEGGLYWDGERSRKLTPGEEARLEEEGKLPDTYRIHPLGTLEELKARVDAYFNPGKDDDDGEWTHEEEEEMFKEDSDHEYRKLKRLAFLERLIKLAEGQK